MNLLACVLVLSFVSRYLGLRRFLGLRNANNCLLRATRLDPDDTLSKEKSCVTNKLDLRTMFQSLKEDSNFMGDYWQKKPMHIPFMHRAILRNAFTMEDLKVLVETNFLFADRCVIDPRSKGWKITPVSLPKGKSFTEAKLNFDDIEKALQFQCGTVVFNSAGAYMQPMARICLDAMNAFHLPTALNIYITNSGQRLSAPLHTDKQDVFVMQTSGRKHWRVYSPPLSVRPTFAKRNKKNTNEKGIPLLPDIYSRGKGDDVLSPYELSDTKPLVDVILKAGDVLYIPAGFPHTTDTILTESNDNTDENPISVHLTLGIDRIIWGLTYADLFQRWRSHLHNNSTITQRKTQYYTIPTDIDLVGVDLYMKMHRNCFPRETNANVNILESFFGYLERFIAPKNPQLFLKIAAEESSRVDYILNNVIHKHYMNVMDIFHRLYADIGKQDSSPQQLPTVLRAHPYLQELQNCMESYRRL